ncbi:MAG: sodium:phosphate symporter, partial [Candidatus Nanohalobium sp.]
MSIGILSFLLTISVYIPAVVLGLFTLQSFDLGFLEVLGPTSLQYSITAVFGPSVAKAYSLTGPVPGFLISFFLLFFSLKQFDKSFSEIGEEQFRNRYVRFLLSNKWLSLAAGAVLTVLTTSVSLSLGIIVPLYNRGYIKRKEIIPYIMGANVTTLADTMLAAIVLETAVGMKTLLVLAFSATVVTAVFLAVYEQYLRSIEYVFNRIVTEEKYFGAFVGLLSAVPLILMLI